MQDTNRQDIQFTAKIRSELISIIDVSCWVPYKAHAVSFKRMQQWANVIIRTIV